MKQLVEHGGQGERLQGKGRSLDDALVDHDAGGGGGDRAREEDPHEKSQQEEGEEVGDLHAENVSKHHEVGHHGQQRIHERPRDTQVGAARLHVDFLEHEVPDQRPVGEEPDEASQRGLQGRLTPPGLGVTEALELVPGVAEGLRDHGQPAESVAAPHLIQEAQIGDLEAMSSTSTRERL